MRTLRSLSYGTAAHLAKPDSSSPNLCVCTSFRLGQAQLIEFSVVLFERSKCAARPAPFEGFPPCSDVNLVSGGDGVDFLDAKAEGSKIYTDNTEVSRIIRLIAEG